MDLPTDIRISTRGTPAADHWILGLPAGARPENDRLPPSIREAAVAALERHRDRPAGWRAEATVDVGRRNVRVSVRGLSPAAELDARGLRHWLDEAVAGAYEEGAARGVVVLPAGVPCLSSAEDGARVLTALALSGYRFDRFRESPRAEGRRTLWVIPPAGGESELRAARAPALAAATGVGFARDLGNTPPNEATPAWIADRARELGRETSARVRVLGPKELARRGMGGVLAVGGGSVHEPRLVQMERGNRGPRVALVGKGVTFDSGGLSIKPAASMEEMKYDKCGACTVLGTFRAVAELGLPIRLACFLPLAENLPAATAYRPSDIVRCANGKTVEIVNTDAEGRMILADALHLAAGWKPDHLVELSTLTGACVVALGEEAAALYSPDDGLADALGAAAASAGERIWRMPLWPEFVEQMKGEHADLKNSGGRWGGANLAAAFLSQFVGDVSSWAHVDIAGPAYTTKSLPGRAAGATGFGILTLLQWLRTLVAR